jgi:hypothetical protein
MTNREAALKSVRAGDIFNVEDDGPTLICLALSVTEAVILARSITTQHLFEFDRETGVAVHQLDGRRYHWTINSIAPLPVDIRESMLSIDRKFREYEYRWAEDPDWEPATEESVLTKDQIGGLIFVDDFYRANPI